MVIIKPICVKDNNNYINLMNEWTGIEKKIDNITFSKTLDFIPNRCVSFKCLKESWHGVFPIKKDTNYNRNSLRFLYYVSV